MSVNPNNSTKRSYKSRYYSLRDRLMASQGREAVLGDLLARSVLERDNLIRRLIPLPPTLDIIHPMPSSPTVSATITSEPINQPPIISFPSISALSLELNVPAVLPHLAAVPHPEVMPHLEDIPYLEAMPEPPMPLAIHLPESFTLPIFPPFNPSNCEEIFSQEGDVAWKLICHSSPPPPVTCKPFLNYHKGSKQRKSVKLSFLEEPLEIAVNLPEGICLRDPRLSYPLSVCFPTCSASSQDR